MTEIHRGAFTMGVLFVLAGVVFFLDAIGAWELRATYVLPLMLIGGGIAVLLSGLTSTHEG